jgi:hypothetical protein
MSVPCINKSDDLSFNLIRAANSKLQNQRKIRRGSRGLRKPPLRVQGRALVGAQVSKPPGSSWILMIWYALKSISWTLNLTSLVAFKAIQRHFSI